MNRRKILKLTGLTGTAVALSPLLGFKKPQSLTNAPSGLGHISAKLGTLEMLIVTDGYITLSSPQPVFAPGIDSAEVKRTLCNLYLPEDKLESAINVLVIKKEEKIILIDTGSGGHLGVTGGWLAENLFQAGISTANITDIVITHAHIDHIGGIIGKDDQPVFKNATYHIAKKEYNFWMGDNPNFSQSKNSNDPSESILFARNTLNSVKDRLELFDYGATLFSCLKTELAEGHTPGHTVFTICSEDKTLKHVVDVFHTPLLVSQPKWGTQWDVDFTKGVKTRIQILEKAVKDRELLMTTHLPWPGLGYIKKDKGNFEWKPLAYSTPNRLVL